MKPIILSLYIILLVGVHTQVHAQNELLITDLQRRKTTTIRPGIFSYIKCYTHFNDNKRIFINGYVKTILDSSIVLRGRGVIPISHIDNIDQVTFKQTLLIGTLAGVVGFGLNLWLNPGFRNETTNAVIGIGCIGFATAYLLNFDRRRLKRNKVGERVRLEVVKATFR